MTGPTPPHSPAGARRRHAVAGVCVLAVEAYFFIRYRQQGALFHFWLHALLGAWLGLTLLTALRLLRRPPPARGRRARPWEAAFGGHLYSAVPDVLFLAAGVLHAAWMDVFAVHITAHFLWPNALVAAFTLWSLAVLGFAALALGRRRAAAALTAMTLLTLAGVVALREPAPTSLVQVVRQQDRDGVAASSWICSVATN